jgi:hypothetical protein
MINIVVQSIPTCWYLGCHARRPKRLVRRLQYKSTFETPDILLLTVSKINRAPQYHASRHRPISQFLCDFRILGSDADSDQGSTSQNTLLTRLFTLCHRAHELMSICAFTEQQDPEHNHQILISPNSSAYT